MQRDQRWGGEPVTFPIPDEALDDRIAVVGTAGAGKTYAAGTAVERVMVRGGRVIIPDPLGVWWGLRLSADGETASRHSVVIFGGPHGDLPINEHAGALVGETVAGMAESAIIDLSQFGTKAAERRFMLAFLTALYRKASGEPVHLVFDEADMWAPERLLDKEGEAAKLLGMMETVVRRGRIKGFIPWLISQRPAVLSKNVLSQADGLVAMKLTGHHDRKAVGAWIEGQADPQEGKRILASLASMQRGEGVVWVPSRNVLKTVTFPEKRTFDSSRTPRRGETVTTAALSPLDLPALRDRMATVEAETKANDTALLKAEITRLKREAAKTPAPAPAVDPQAIEQARKDGYADGHRVGYAVAYEARTTDLYDLCAKIAGVDEAARTARDRKPEEPAHAPPQARQQPRAPVAPVQARQARVAPVHRPAGDAVRPAPQQRILNALAWAEAVGIDRLDKTRLAFFADASPRSSAFQNNVSALRVRGFVDYPTAGDVALTAGGRADAEAVDIPMTTADLQRMVLAKLPRPQQAILAALIACYPDPLTKADLGARAGASPASSAFQNNVSALRSLGLVDYPQQGYVAATSVLLL